MVSEQDCRAWRAHEAPPFHRHENRDTQSSWGTLEGELMAPLLLSWARTWAASGLSGTAGAGLLGISRGSTHSLLPLFPR